MTVAPASREFVAATAEDGGVPETPAEGRERAHAAYRTALDCEEAAARVIAYDQCPIAPRAPDVLVASSHHVLEELSR